jgi:hypothetical protein
MSADQSAPVHAALAGRLGLEAAASAGIEGAEAAVLDALRKGEPYQRWLLIFDNAEQLKDLNEIIRAVDRVITRCITRSMSVPGATVWP